MASDKQKTTFDELVAGISSEERKFLLARLNGTTSQELPILHPKQEIKEAGYLTGKYKREPLFYRIILWLRSAFSKRSKEELYNEDLIISLAKKVNHNHPGLIDQRNNLLLSMFYERLKELKSCSDFFKPYLTEVNSNPGKFYVFLSTFIAPELSQKISQDADPYTIPFERDATTELRSSLLKKMEAAFKDINPAVKNKLYAAVQSVIWIKNFTELPFLHFIAQFTSIISNSYTCPYSNAQTDYPAFARVLDEAVPISKNVLEALFLYPHRDALRDTALSQEAENQIREFMNKSAGCINKIQMFISSVPIRTLGRIIYGDYQWENETSGGGEDWFVKFREEWKCVFEQRWKNWKRDQKKQQLTSVLQNNFGLTSFPELQYRPWSRLWGGIPFNCELTAGFLSWFAQDKFNECMSTLNVIVLEGIFINKENRTELSEAINTFVDANQQVLAFVNSIKPDGSVGGIFQKMIDEHVRTLKGQGLIDTVILNSEVSVRSCGRMFCESTRTIEMIFKGILDDEKIKGYETLQNLMTLKGHDNHKFREDMGKCRTMLNIARSILVDVEPLDLPND